MKVREQTNTNKENNMSILYTLFTIWVYCMLGLGAVYVVFSIINAIDDADRRERMAKKDAEVKPEYVSPYPVRTEADIKAQMDECAKEEEKREEEESYYWS
jgi:hypothetical protein